MKYIIPFRYFILFLFSVIFISCGKADNEYWYDAVQKMKDNKNEEAINIFGKLIEDHPESKFAPKALYETAKLYHSRKIKNLSLQESLNKAIEYYNKLVSDYPKSPDAPNALFMVGFIEANELSDYQAATRDFNLLISKYPDHELVSSAKSELDNMGVPPEEFLDNKLANQK